MPRYHHPCERCEFLGYFANWDLYHCSEEKRIIARCGPGITLYCKVEIDKVIECEEDRFDKSVNCTPEARRALYKGLKRYLTMQEYDHAWDVFQAAFRNKHFGNNETEDQRFLYYLKSKAAGMVDDCLSSGEFCNSEMLPEECKYYDELTASKNKI